MALPQTPRFARAAALAAANSTQILPECATAVAVGRNLDFGGSHITTCVGIGRVEHGGFGLTVALDLDAPGIAPDEAVDLTNRA